MHLMISKREKAYKANKEAYCSSSKSYIIILHPCSSHSHPSFKIVCCGENANNKI